MTDPREFRLLLSLTILAIIVGATVPPVNGYSAPLLYYIDIYTVDKDTGLQTEAPFTLHVEIRSGDRVLKEQNLTSNLSPQSIPVDWYMTENPLDSKVYLTLSQDGYLQSDIFVHDLYFDSPTGSSVLYKIDFQLEPDPAIPKKITMSKTFTVNEANETYGILVESQVKDLSFSFNKEKKEIMLILPSVEAKGRLTIVIPIELLGAPYAISVDGVTILEAKKQINQTDAKITVDYGAGSKEVVIQGSTAIPEFPLTWVVMTLTISIVLVASLWFSRRMHGIESKHH